MALQHVATEPGGAAALPLVTQQDSATEGTIAVIAASPLNPSLRSTNKPSLAAGYWASKHAVISGKSERKGPIIVQSFQT